MLGKASEIRHKQISRSPVFSFNLEDHARNKRLDELLKLWLDDHPDYIIQSISFYAIDRTEVAHIIYKEAE